MEGIMEKRRKNVMQVILVMIYIVLTLSGLVIMKLGLNTV